MKLDFENKMSIKIFNAELDIAESILGYVPIVLCNPETTLLLSSHTGDVKLNKTKDHLDYYTYRGYKLLVDNTLPFGSYDIR